MATVSQLADYLTDGYWHDMGDDPPPYHFDHNTITVNMDGLKTQAEKDLALAALGLWHQVANVTFQLTSDDCPDIYYSDVNDGPGGVTIPIGNLKGNYYAAVNIRSDFFSALGDTIDGQSSSIPNSFMTYIHETGHALGLGHLGP